MYNLHVHAHFRHDFLLLLAVVQTEGDLRWGAHLGLTADPHIDIVRWTEINYLTSWRGFYFCQHAIACHLRVLWQAKAAPC